MKFVLSLVKVFHSQLGSNLASQSKSVARSFSLTRKRATSKPQPWSLSLYLMFMSVIPLKSSRSRPNYTRHFKQTCKLTTPSTRRCSSTSRCSTSVTVLSKELKAVPEAKVKETRQKVAQEVKEAPLGRNKPKPLVLPVCSLQVFLSLSISSKSSLRSKRVIRMVQFRSSSFLLSLASTKHISFSVMKQLAKFSTPSLVKLSFQKFLTPSLVSATLKYHSNSPRCLITGMINLSKLATRFLRKIRKSARRKAHWMQQMLVQTLLEKKVSHLLETILRLLKSRSRIHSSLVKIQSCCKISLKSRKL